MSDGRPRTHGAGGLSESRCRSEPSGPARDLASLAEGHHCSVVQDEHRIQRRERTRTVRYDDRTAPRRAISMARERRLALGIEVRIGFVEHDEERFAVQRPSETYALTLARRQQRPAVADGGRVPLRQRYDQIVCAGRHGRFEYGLLVRSGLEPADVVGDRAVEQRDFLWQVADVATKRVAVPLVEAGAIEADVTPDGRPDADDGACERGFTRIRSRRTPRSQLQPAGQTRHCRQSTARSPVERRSVAAPAGGRPGRQGYGRDGRRRPRRPLPDPYARQIRCFQASSTISIGASARPIMIDDAIMMPPLACSPTTSAAPIPRTADCST